jgi:hypothetical protein
MQRRSVDNEHAQTGTSQNSVEVVNVGHDVLAEGIGEFRLNCKYLEGGYRMRYNGSMWRLH